MLTIEQLTAGQAAAALDELVELLQDAVASGASVGFLPPLSSAEARDYWGVVCAAVGHGARMLLVARQGRQVIGSVQLELPAKPNASHRAEVQKLLVHTRARRQGIGRRLMEEVEAAALQAGRTLLVLDTRQGDAAERLYARHGYTRAGAIPQYAQSADGTLHTTVFFYRVLEND
jgi:ribosomal protein S18 acetylase RimI-like enzyme